MSFDTTASIVCTAVSIWLVAVVTETSKLIIVYARAEATMHRIPFGRAINNNVFKLELDKYNMLLNISTSNHYLAGKYDLMILGSNDYLGLSLKILFDVELINNCSGTVITVPLVSNFYYLIGNNA